MRRSRSASAVAVICSPDRGQPPGWPVPPANHSTDRSAAGMRAILHRTWRGRVDPIQPLRLGDRDGAAGRGGLKPPTPYREAMAQRLLTERLVLRPWTIDDAAAALGAYGDAEVARWLVPSMDRVLDAAAMRLVLQQWVAEDTRLQVPAGRWAIELREGGRLIGGGTPLPPPPGGEVQIRCAPGPAGWGGRD